MGGIIYNAFSLRKTKGGEDEEEEAEGERKLPAKAASGATFYVGEKY